MKSYLITHKDKSTLRVLIDKAINGYCKVKVASYGSDGYYNAVGSWDKDITEEDVKYQIEYIKNDKDTLIEQTA